MRNPQPNFEVGCGTGIVAFVLLGFGISDGGGGGFNGPLMGLGVLMMLTSVYLLIVAWATNRGDQKL